MLQFLKKIDISMNNIYHLPTLRPPKIVSDTLYY